MSDRRKERIQRRFERHLSRGLNMGAVTADEAEALRTQAELSTDWLMILELIMAILEMIREFLENR